MKLVERGMGSSASAEEKGGNKNKFSNKNQQKKEN
jgi:hypothetical protein